MLAADVETFPLQLVAQHRCARERVLQVQFVDAPHQLLIGLRRSSRHVVGAAQGDVNQFGLAFDAQLVIFLPRHV